MSAFHEIVALVMANASLARELRAFQEGGCRFNEDDIRRAPAPFAPQLLGFSLVADNLAVILMDHLPPTLESWLR
jgi:hypothetical protein